MRSVDRFQMANPEVAKVPYAYYAAMREQEPIHLDQSTGIYWVSLNADVSRMAMDTEALSSKSRIMLRTQYQPRAQAIWDAAGMKAIDTFVTGDSPDHEHYRAVGMTLFNPKKVAELADRIETRVHKIIDDFSGRTQVEFIEHFAARLPGSIVCDEFGLPPEDQPRFKAWTDSVIALQTPGIGEDTEVELVTLMVQLFQYLESHLKTNEGHPSGRIIHTLATATRKDGTPFSALERAWMLVFIFGGSNETTINMLTCGIRRMARDPQLQARLRNDPGAMPIFIEELLRLDGSVQSLLRVATRDLHFDTITIPAGANVMLCIASANRDPARWSDADTFSLDRSDGRRHMSFGQGPHTCIGNHLARRILQSAFSILLSRLDHIELTIPDDEVPQLPLPFHRGIAALPIQFTYR